LNSNLVGMKLKAEMKRAAVHLAKALFKNGFTMKN
jgi:hypothetical protein